MTTFVREPLCETRAADARYRTEFNLCRPAGTVVAPGLLLIEKRLAQAHPFRNLLPERERGMTRYLHAAGLPVAPLADPGWNDPATVCTRFSGVNLGWAARQAGLTRQDMTSLWRAAMLTAHRFAEAGVLPVDMAARNIALPLDGTTQGRLCFDSAVLIDHAYTIGTARDAPQVRTPVWIDARQGTLAPELKDALRHEQQEALCKVNKRGLGLQALATLVDHGDAEQRFAAIDLGDAALQSRLRRGEIDIDAALQCSIGLEALRTLRDLRQRRPASPATAGLESLAGVFERMAQALPTERYSSLAEAADALGARDGRVPARSDAQWPALNIADLIRRPEGASNVLQLSDRPRVRGATDDGSARTIELDALDEGLSSSAPPDPTAAAPGPPPPCLPPSTSSPDRRRLVLASGGVAAFLALGVLAARPATPENLRVHLALQHVAAAARRLAGGAGDPDPDFRMLQTYALDPDLALRRSARRVIDSEWKRIVDRLIRTPAVVDGRPLEFDRALWQQLLERVRAMADAGHEDAVALRALMIQSKPGTDHGG